MHLLRAFCYFVVQNEHKMFGSGGGIKSFGKWNVKYENTRWRHG
jgi:hypothetical protein